MNLQKANEYFTKAFELIFEVENEFDINTSDIRRLGYNSRIELAEFQNAIRERCQTEDISKLKQKLPPMPKVFPRLPYDDRKPNGLQESLLDWCRHNDYAVEWFLENSEAIREIIKQNE